MSGRAAAGLNTPSDYFQVVLEVHCIVTSAVLLWYDCILTFREELQCIWRRRFTGATAVYLATRYIAAIERVVLVLMGVLWTINDETCNMLSQADNALTFLFYTSYSVFTILRVYGICNRNWVPLLLVVPLACISPIMFLIGNAPSNSIQGGRLAGCVFDANSLAANLSFYGTISTIGAASTIMVETIVLVITWRRTYRIHKETKALGFPTSFATLLLVDGTVYLLVLILTQTANIASNVTKKLYVWYYFTEVFTVIFQSRLILGLRGLYFFDPEREGLLCMSIISNSRGICDGDGQSVTSPGRFTISSAVVGNLGAPMAVRRGGFDIGEDMEDELEENDGLLEGRERPVFARDPFRKGMEMEAKLALQT